MPCSWAIKISWNNGYTSEIFQNIVINMQGIAVRYNNINQAVMGMCRAEISFVFSYFNP